MANIKWTKLPSDASTARTSDFLIRYSQGVVPGALWLPDDRSPEGLILVGHGGSRPKRDITTIEFVGKLVELTGFAVAAIDGPIHGVRRGENMTAPADIQREFLDLWEGKEDGVEGMVSDWMATLTKLKELKELKNIPVGYYGLSMGTAYGLPFLAAEKSIDAAVIGMWGSNYPNSRQLVEAARHVRCPICFLHKSEDQIFTLNGAFEIFDALLTDDKRMLISTGPHEPATAEQMKVTLDFFENRLIGG